MNRGRHKKNNISKIDNIKKYLLLNYGAKNLDKWKNFTLEEVQWLIDETHRQQQKYALDHGKRQKRCNLSIYEDNCAASKYIGGIRWSDTPIGFDNCEKLMSKLIHY